MKLIKNLILGLLFAISPFLFIVFALHIRAYAGTSATMSEAIYVESIEYDYREYKEVFEKMSDLDREYLAKALECECGNTNIECIEGTCCVILNRVLSSEWPDSVYEVVNQAGQFSTRPKFKKAIPSLKVNVAICNVVSHGAKVIRHKLAEQGWDYAVTDYVFFDMRKQPGYSQDFITVGEIGNQHFLGRAK